MTDCVFCEKIKGGTVEKAGYNISRFEPLNPVVPGHMLFVPHEHLEDASTSPYVTGQVFDAASSYAWFRGVPFNLITSAGSEATQTVFHLHVHYVPRREGDGLHLPWTGQVKND